jgi:phosphatidylserine decarboxylase
MLAKGSAHVIAIPFIVGFVLVCLWIWYLAVLAFAFGVLLAVFFRDPERSPGRGICSAADGVVLNVEEREGALLISTFMNVHNVHVNRAPLQGKVVKVEKKGGGHKPAFSRGAAENAQGTITLSTDLGLVKVVQISGTFAWRVVQYVSVGQNVKKGQRIGIIRFGSRVDLYLPAERVRSVVGAGERVRAGETTVAEVL